MDHVAHELRAATPIKGGWGDLSVTLLWRPADPYAVAWYFREIRKWMCSRELLAQGLTEPTATYGDMLFVPLGEAIDVMLRSPNGQLVLRFHKPDLQGFLDATTALVPLGAERIDWRAELARLGGAR